ncbi:MAG: shikimate kinase [Desulfobulbaceae bacterium]|nr:shikimate kinase [Desulfobulbaceae bacterium]
MNSSKDSLIIRRPPKRVVLTGFRATGKTTVGQALARELGYDFLDTDQELTTRMGCSIAEHVERHGWDSFRELEKSLLVELCSREELVISTGGGAITHREPWERLAEDSLVVWLRADAETICSRMTTDLKSNSQRPSLTGANPVDEVLDLLKKRTPLYLAGSHIALDTEGMSVARLVSRIKNQLETN